MNPIICVIWCSKAAANFLPLPFPVWATFFALLFTVLNLQGVRTSARTNAVIAGGLGLVILVFLAAAFRYLSGVTLDAAALTRPFYDPATFSWEKVSTGTSLAVLTYIGFDGISTLSEEAKNPRRNILLATVLVCLFTGIVGSLQVYLAQLIWPDWSSYPDVDTAFVHVAGRAGGPILFAVLNLSLLVANVGSGMGAHLGASRLLYGMGRDDAIPRRFFGAVNPRSHVPSNNVILVGAIALAGAFTVSYGLGAEMLNFGAFIAFMGVNLSALLHYWWRAERKALLNLVPPLLGFLICAYLWWSLSGPARVAGFVWLATGVAYGAWKTQGFRKPIEFREANDEEAR
jgi:amino acid transporter